MTDDAAIPFDEQFEFSDSAGAVPDGAYKTCLTKIEKFVGTRFQSEQPQDKLRFVLEILEGEQQGNSIWKIENLPDKTNGRRKGMGRKSGCRKFIGTLLGRELGDNEVVQPSSLLGIKGLASIRDGKLAAFIPEAEGN